MKRILVIYVLAALSLTLTACNYPATLTPTVPAADQTPTSPPLPTPLATATQPDSTAVSAATNTAAAFPTETSAAGPTITPTTAGTTDNGFPPQRLTATPSPDITTQTIHDETDTPPTIIDVKYPVLAEAASPNAAAFNSAVKSLIDETITGFRNPLQTPIAPDAITGPNSLYIDYEITEQTDERISVYFRMSTYNQGAAHPLPFSRTLTFNLAQGKPLALADLFAPGADYLGRLSSLSIADLNQRGVLGWDTGAQPLEENFQNWNTTPEGLRITFDPYAVSAYAMGYQEVLIPWPQLQDLLAP